MERQERGWTHDAMAGGTGIADDAERAQPWWPGR
jgi:hypothetical protein